MAKSKKETKSKDTMVAVKSMVDFMKDEVDRAVAHLSKDSKIESSNASSVSNVIKMSLDSAFIKAAGQIEKTL